MADTNPDSKLSGPSTDCYAHLQTRPVTIFPPGSPPSVSHNRFTNLIPSQSIAVVSEFTLESGVTLTQVPVGFRTWGKLNDR